MAALGPDVSIVGCIVPGLSSRWGTAARLRWAGGWNGKNPVGAFHSHLCRHTSHCHCFSGTVSFCKTAILHPKTAVDYYNLQLTIVNTDHELNHQELNKYVINNIMDHQIQYLSKVGRTQLYLSK